MYKNYLKMRHDKDMAYLNNELGLETLGVQQRFTSEENSKNRAMQKYGIDKNYQSDMAKVAASKDNAASRASGSAGVGIILRDGNIPIAKGSDQAFVSNIAAKFRDANAIRNLIKPKTPEQSKALESLHKALENRTGSATSAYESRQAINNLLASLTDEQEAILKNTIIYPAALSTFNNNVADYDAAVESANDASSESEEDVNSRITAAAQEE